MRRAASLAALAAILTVAGCSSHHLPASEPGGRPPADKGYHQETQLDNVRLRVESPRPSYPVGAPIPLTLVVQSTGDQPYTLDMSQVGALREPYTRAALAEPRPVADLLFTGYYLDLAGERHDYSWAWSESAPTAKATRLTLQPGESRVLISTVWQPPAARYMQGAFLARFADRELPAGVQIELPRR